MLPRSFKHLSDEDFLRFKRENRETLIEWIYSLAMHFTKSFEEQLTVEERNDSFTMSIETIYAALDYATSPGAFVEFVRRRVIWNAKTVLAKTKKLRQREISMDSALDEAKESGNPNEVIKADAEIGAQMARNEASTIEVRDARAVVRQRLKPRDQKLLDLIESGLLAEEICAILGYTKKTLEKSRSQLRALVRKILAELETTDSSK
jgi:DNA-binding CsgD family transcriptional regulator